MNGLSYTQQAQRAYERAAEYKRIGNYGWELMFWTHIRTALDLICTHSRNRTTRRESAELWLLADRRWREFSQEFLYRSAD